MPPSPMTPWRICAALIALSLITMAVLLPDDPNLLLMAGGLLLCWHMAFVEGPTVRRTLGDTYRGARHGGLRTSTTAKLVSLAGIVLVLAGTYERYSTGW
ncbi:MAG: hypothetical protein ABW193_11755 [Luteibacter sp.]